MNFHNGMWLPKFKDSADKDSIQNQKAIIQQYIELNPDIKVFKYYIDDGVSSFKDVRSAFEEMMWDIKCDLINTVIVKDISRFGRNYIETGTYLETIFPRIGIRFISVSEEIDSRQPSHIPKRKFSKLINLKAGNSNVFK